jgi:exonuclease VII small subunit
MSTTDTSTGKATAITFEDGYRRLQEIAERVGSEEVPVHEMCDLFAEGKGLDQALSGYLAKQKARVEAIDQGEGVQRFEIVAPAGGSDDDVDFESAIRSDVAFSTADFPRDAPSRQAAPAPADDDIPF